MVPTAGKDTRWGEIQDGEMPIQGGVCGVHSGRCLQWGVIVVLVIRRCAHGGEVPMVGSCPRWGHAQGACNREVLVVLTMGRCP